ncbi:MAG TPA: hypothetical protein VHV81_05635 [Steroidobacteraceae bacterium]|jgi:hypothetical protein|nr:hypothetical protein [Steroidobacteraceae bacterium]
MLILQIAGTILIALLVLALLSALRGVLESAASRASTGIDLRKSRRMNTDWRVIESLSVGDEQD